MIKIKEFTSSDKEFKEIAKIFNLVSHDYLVHYKDDMDEWQIRDKTLLNKRFLLYNNNIPIGYVTFKQGKKENNRTVFFTIKIIPKNGEKKYLDVLYDEMLKKN